MGAAAVEALDALFLVHAERRAEETAVVVVVQVERTFLGIQELTHVATEVHHGAVFQAGNGHFFDVLDRQIDVQPIVSVVSVTVIINFIYLVERTRRVVHQHDVIGVQVFSAAYFLVETLGRVSLGLLGIFPVDFRCPSKRSRRLSVGIDQHTVNRFHHVHLLLFQFLFGGALLGCFAQ